LTLLMVRRKSSFDSANVEERYVTRNEDKAEMNGRQ
jgi:hypothetical protein